VGSIPAGANGASVPIFHRVREPFRDVPSFPNLKPSFGMFPFPRTLLTLVATTSLASSPAWRFQPPADSGIVNVRDYGAKGDGIADDTAAIARAISENIDKSRYRANPFIYLPAGTYLVSDSIEGRIIEEGRDQGKVWSAGWRAMLILIGESREETILRLKDNAPGFQDPANPKWMLATGSEHDDRNNQPGGGNRAFRHNILNLTIDVGQGNPGAIGIDFVANNRGSIDGVTLRAGKNSGHTAINLTRWWPGPAMVHDVRIEGFEHAIRLDHYQYGMTFENISIRGVRGTAVTNTNNVAVMRRIDFEGSAPFYEGKGGHSMLSLLDSKLTFTGAGEAAAISSGGIVNLRRIVTSGFARAVQDLRKEGAHLAATMDGPFTIETHDQGFTFSPGNRAAKPLDLPIDDIQTLRPPAGAAWTDGGSTCDSLQAAIDAGAEWIYLRPVQTVRFSKPVILRNKVKLIMGFHGFIEGPAGKDAKGRGDEPPALIVGDGESDIVALEHLFIGGRVENPSKRTLMIRHCDLEQHGLLANGPGKSHVMDVIGRNYHIGEKHSFFARQLNAEFGPDPLFTNAGTSVVLGFKMETSPSGSKDAPNSTPSLVNQGGNLEVFGGLLYTLGTDRNQAPKVPAFTNTRGNLAVSFRNNGRPETFYPIVLREGILESGEDTPLSTIKGPGAALLSSSR
jgi:hypothetical protein